MLTGGTTLYGRCISISFTSPLTFYPASRYIFRRCEHGFSLFKIKRIKIQPIKLLDSYTWNGNQQWNVSVKSSSISYDYNVAWSMRHIMWTRDDPDKWPCEPKLMLKHLTIWLTNIEYPFQTHLLRYNQHNDRWQKLHISSLYTIRWWLNLTLLHLLHHTAVFLSQTTLVSLCRLFAGLSPSTAHTLQFSCGSMPCILPQLALVFWSFPTHIIHFTCVFIPSNTDNFVAFTQ